MTGALLLIGVGLLGAVLMITLTKLARWKQDRSCGARNVDKGVRCAKAPGHLETPGGYHAAHYMGGVYYWADDAVGAVPEEAAS